MQTSTFKKIILSLSFIAFTSILIFASLPLPEFRFKIDLEKQLTNELGVVGPAQVAACQVGDHVIIRKEDGVIYKGKVTEIEETQDMIKIYGDLYDKENELNFGFIMAKGGTFAGAIVNKKKNKVYVLEFSIEQKGYVFRESLVHRKPEA